jgi:ribA/ribD-fused uncharacterized protein
MVIKFYKVTDQYGCFSNFSKHGFELDGRYWPTSEHYFQAQKFECLDIQEKIRRAKTPLDAARMGRDKNRPIRSDWEEIKDDVMKIALLQKFTTYSELVNLLFSTGDEDIVENTQDDYYWGCGKNGTGKNVLGKLLMDIRAILRRNM